MKSTEKKKVDIKYGILYIKFINKYTYLIRLVLKILLILLINIFNNYILM